MEKHRAYLITILEAGDIEAFIQWLQLLRKRELNEEACDEAPER